MLKIKNNNDSKFLKIREFITTNDEYKGLKVNMIFVNQFNEYKRRDDIFLYEIEQQLNIKYNHIDALEITFDGSIRATIYVDKDFDILIDFASQTVKYDEYFFGLLFPILNFINNAEQNS